MSVASPLVDSSPWVAAVTTALSLLLVSALVLALSLVTRIGLWKRSASMHALLGRVTVVCLLLVPLGAAISPAFPALQLVRIQLEPNRKSRLLDEVSPNSSLVVHQFGRSEPTRIDPSQLGPPPRDPFQQSRQPAQAWTIPAALGIWFLVAAGLLIRLAISHVAVWRMWRRSKPVLSENVRRVSDSRLSGTRTSTSAIIHQSGEVRVPVCIGLLRRRVLLPEESEGWTNQQIRWSLDHELVHVDRRDVLWSTLTELLTCLFWINPLMWLFRRSFFQDMESACDDAVLAGDSDSVGYAELLVGIARRASEEQGSTRRAAVAAIPMAATHGFRKRVNRILDTSRDRRPVDFRTACITAAIGLVSTASALAIRPEIAALPRAASPSEIVSSAMTRDRPLRFSTWHAGMTAGRVDVVDAAWITGDKQLVFFESRELDAILAVDPISAMMLAKYFDQVPRNERPALHALGVTENVLAMLETGRLDSAVSRQPYGLGYRAVEMLIRERLSLLPEDHPPHLAIPTRSVDRSSAALLARELEEGRTLTFDSRLDNSGLSIELEFPARDHPEHAAWWKLVLLGCEQAAAQFDADLDVTWGAEAMPGSSPSFFGFDQFALAFPVSDAANSIFSASVSVASEIPAESRFALGTSATQMAEVTAQMIATSRMQEIKLCIIGHDTFRPTAESLLPILIDSLRGL